jgi:hypothetical protein
VLAPGTTGSAVAAFIGALTLSLVGVVWLIANIL